MDNAKHYDDTAIALIDARCKSNTHRINELQEHQTALDRLATSVEVLTPPPDLSRDKCCWQDWRCHIN